MRVLSALLIAAVASVCVASCGSSSDSAGTLLKETFSGSHTVNSGNLAFSLTINPTGSSTLTGPITLSFGGPFQSMGAGKLPKSNFNVTISAQGKSASLGLLSTGTTGYVTLQGASYQLPQATFQQLESSFAGLASSPTGASSKSTGTLSKLGIHPLDWLSHPSVVGAENVGSTKTTHITAAVNVAALLGDLNTFLAKASSLGVSGSAKLPSSLSASTRSRIAAEVRDPTFDLWTGTGDKTIRKLAIGLTLPVSGQLQTMLGGMRSAQIGLTISYTELNQPQSIAAPTTVRPFSEFTTKLQTFLSSIRGASGSTAATTSSPVTATAGSPVTGATGSPSSAPGPSLLGTSGAPASSATVRRYSQCIIQAHDDIVKMQGCASLINGH